MTRLEAIRARLKDELVEQNYCSCIGQEDGSVDYCSAHAHAPADLALLLAVAEAARNMPVRSDHCCDHCVGCGCVGYENLEERIACRDKDGKPHFKDCRALAFLDSLAPLLAEDEPTKGEQP